MNKKLIFEVRRKLFHLFTLLYIWVYLIVKDMYSHNIALLILAGIIVFFMIVEFYRLRMRGKIPIFGFLWRKKEKNTIGGEIAVITGVLIAFAVFDFNIAVTVILMLVFGDMAAALFGIAFGKHWLKSIPDTAWEGIIAEFIVDMIITMFLIPNLWIGLSMALTATFVETVFIHIDDNIGIPVGAGFVGQVLVRLVG